MLTLPTLTCQTSGPLKANKMTFDIVKSFDLSPQIDIATLKTTIYTTSKWQLSSVLVANQGLRLVNKL